MAVEGNESVYQVNPARRISGEGRAEFLRTWGPDFDQKGQRFGVGWGVTAAALVLCRISDWRGFGVDIS